MDKNKMLVAMREQHGDPVGMECSVSYRYWCQLPGSDIPTVVF